MEQALGPRGLSTPDVIKSALDHNNEAAVPKVSANTIDNLFGVPEKITIPERYVPEPVSCLIPILCLEPFLISRGINLSAFLSLLKNI